jgi:uncharacterized OB-fold protein
VSDAPTAMRPAPVVTEDSEPFWSAARRGELVVQRCAGCGRLHPAFSYPVVAVLVDLDEGIRLVSNLVDVEPENVAIGMPVEVTFVPTANDMAVPVFKPRST